MRQKEYSLAGKVALVTGAGQGVGEQIALAFAEAGGEIALAGRNLKNLERVAARVREMGRNALTVGVDVRREREVAAMVKRVAASFGRIDILVNNAGVIHRRTAMDLSLKEWQEEMDVNVTGPFLCMKACQPIMARQARGSIINISSIAGLFGRSNMAAYCASKAAVINLTKALALEWAKFGIRVNAIAPGQLETDMGAPLLNDKKALRDFLKTVPLKRVGKPREVGLVAVLLASDAAAYMTGGTIVIDGGITAA